MYKIRILYTKKGENIGFDFPAFFNHCITKKYP